MNKIAVIMATYNAGDYLLEQLESIHNQTVSNYDLIIHDDGSTDKTIELVKKYIENKKNMKLLDDGIHFHSACGNFFHLMKYLKNKNYDYICFSDQDDIWDKNHIEVLLTEIKKMPNDIPCLVHGDACIVNSNNILIDKSFNKFANIRMNRSDFYSIALHNNVQGSSMMINKEVLNYIPEYIEKIYMYDSYISCITSLYGEQRFIDVQILRYRQHSDNVIGTEKSRSFFDLLNIKNFKEYMDIVKKGLIHSKKQLELLLYYDNDNIKIKNEIRMINSNYFNKVLYVCKFKIIKRLGIKSTLGFVLCNSKEL